MSSWRFFGGVIAIGVLATCGPPPLVLRGAPAAYTPPPRIDGTASPSGDAAGRWRAPTVDPRGTALPLPPVGDARSEALVDGWPVWVVRHADASVSVVSAVAPPRARSAATLFAGPAPLVRWLPGSRRLLAGDVAYDERGETLGYAALGACDADECPRVTEPAPERRALDTFEVTVSGAYVVVGARRPPGPEPAAPVWVDYDHEAHLEREIAPLAAEVRPLAPVAIAAALGRPIGTYALVAGSIVQSTGDAPRLCADAPRCAACDPSSPRAYGVLAVTVSAAVEHVESGTMLVRREPGGLSVIATSRYGACTPGA